MSGKACTVDQLVTALNSNNVKVIDALMNSLQPTIQAAIDDALKTRLSDISVKLDNLAVEFNNRDERIKALQKENGELKTRLHNRERYMDQLETYTKQDNLLIHGLPTHYAEVVAATTDDPTAGAAAPMNENSATTEKIFVTFCANRLGVKVGPEDISVCHRLRKSKNVLHSPIIVWFTNRKARAAVLAARKQLRPPRGIGTTPPIDHVYINEHLTKYMSQLFTEARRMVKAERINKVWTYNGRVTVKLRDNSIHTVNCLAELEGLI
jgi:hypothetical protein